MYAEIFLKKFRMFDCKSMATPLTVNEKLKKEVKEKRWMPLYTSLVGNLLYLTATRPDIILQQVCCQGSYILQVIFTLQ
jgi:hypothetical protein